MSASTAAVKSRHQNGHKDKATQETVEADEPSQVPAEESQAAAVPATAQSARALTVAKYAEYAGAGMEDMEASELLIPFVRMLQAMSPMCTEGNPAYDPDARAGMIINTATGQIYPREVGIGFIPCARDASYSEWVPIQGNGGGGGAGFRGTWDHKDPRIAPLRKAQGEFRKLVTAEGTELVETRTLYGVVVPRDKDGTWITDEAGQGVIAFSSTQLKKYRLIMSRITALMGTPQVYPMWSWRWNLGAQPEKNARGSYYGWKLSLDGDTKDKALMEPDDSLFMMAAELRSLVRGGLAKADMAPEDHSDVETSGGGGQKPAQDQADIDSEIPF